jgi:hypothetical protein
MMTIEQLKEGQRLLREIEQTEHILAAYRNAEEIVVALPDPKAPLGWRHDVRLGTGEIGDAIISALTARIASAKEGLIALGVE